MTVVKLSESAHDELLEVLSWIAQESMETALKFLAELQAQSQKILETFPQSGRRFDADTRYITVSGRVVVYEYHLDSDQVLILHFYSPGQDWQDYL